MRLKSETINDLLVVKVLDSAVDAGNALELKADLLPLVEKHRKVAIDMGKVKFMDSSGVGAMLSCLRAIHQNSGELRLFSVKPNLYQLFKLVRLDTLVGIHENRKTALEAFDRNSDANA
ncbi:anti-sigma B factor antagonist [Desulfosalsimonas propionicica]|jgi:anti-sigma B factor antagonist|uniref:Anti-sigma factor antagonist n=1 Tax=Desulfosalsimonas propionicica TaxID=332175 RepID=A0A7W0CBF7_9BACT|nr:STAS domain-containing protein [Desulfosalsimonas propionicica]MBA2882645.1 anti-sigma B factor antagonist [Desulfosalsimonas propionicica]